MTIKEMIDQLSQFPAETKVEITTEERPYGSQRIRFYEITETGLAGKNNDVVFITLKETSRH